MKKLNSLHFFTIKNTMLFTISIILFLTCFCLTIPVLAEDITSKDKVMFYTDGLEDVFILGRDEQSEQPEYSPSLLRWAQLDAEPLVATIGDYLDHREGSLNPADDVTVVVLQVTR